MGDRGRAVRSGVIALALSAASVTVTTRARADSTWYGWQPLVSDGATIAATTITAVAMKPKSAPLPAVILVAGYLVPPPIIHIAHRNGGEAIGSLGLRLGLPALGVLIGVTMEKEKAMNAVFFGVVGMIAASVIDAAALSYEDAEAPPASTAAPLKQNLVFATAF